MGSQRDFPKMYRGSGGVQKSIKKNMRQWGSYIWCRFFNLWSGVFLISAPWVKYEYLNNININSHEFYLLGGETDLSERLQVLFTSKGMSEHLYQQNRSIKPSILQNGCFRGFWTLLVSIFEKRICNYQWIFIVLGTAFLCLLSRICLSITFLSMTSDKKCIQWR